MNQIIVELNNERKKTLEALILVNHSHNKKRLLNIVSEIDSLINKLNIMKSIQIKEIIKDILIEENISKV